MNAEMLKKITTAKLFELRSAIDAELNSRPSGKITYGTLVMWESRTGSTMYGIVEKFNPKSVTVLVTNEFGISMGGQKWRVSQLMCKVVPTARATAEVGKPAAVTKAPTRPAVVAPATAGGDW